MNHKREALNSLALDIESKYPKKSTLEQVPIKLQTLVDINSQQSALLANQSNSILADIPLQARQALEDAQLHFRAQFLKEANQINYSRLMCTSNCYKDAEMKRLQAYECTKQCSRHILKAYKYAEYLQDAMKSKYEECLTKKDDDAKDFLQVASNCSAELSKQLNLSEIDMTMKFKKYKNINVLK